MAYRTGSVLCDGDIIEHNGRTYRVNIEHDDTSGAPWDNECGHGPVSDWTSRDKQPGELLLSSDRNSYRFYDAAEATRIAKADGWGLSDEDTAALEKRVGRTPTRGQVIAEAVLKDFNRMRDWCNDQWEYVGVIVTHIPDDEESEDIENGYMHALWRIESDCYDYIHEVAMEHIAEIERGLEARQVAYWANRNLVTV